MDTPVEKRQYSSEILICIESTQLASWDETVRTLYPSPCVFHTVLLIGSCLDSTQVERSSVCGCLQVIQLFHKLQGICNVSVNAGKI